MTDQEISRAVAESVGWTDVHMYEDDAGPPIHCGYPPNSTYLARVPDYCNSYDAIMPLVKALDGTLKMKFIHALGLDVLKICPLAGDVWMAQEYDCHAMLTAAPRQLCEAYLAVGGADA
jgi:hypothetical protein